MLVRVYVAKRQLAKLYVVIFLGNGVCSGHQFALILLANCSLGVHFSVLAPKPENYYFSNRGTKQTACVDNSCLFGTQHTYRFPSNYCADCGKRRPQFQYKFYGIDVPYTGRMKRKYDLDTGRRIGPLTRHGTYNSSGRPYKRYAGPYAGQYQHVMRVPRSLIGAQGATIGSRGVPETKFVDIALGSTLFTSTATPPVATSLCYPVQGAAAFNRVGQKITLRSLRIRGFVVPTATGIATLGRILVVYDKQANAALPVWTDVILGVTSAAVPSSTITDGLNMANRDRFIVLVDEQFNLPSQTYTGGVLTNLSYPQEKNPSMFNFDRFVKLRNMEMHFNNTNGGSFADIQTGSISIFVAFESTSTAGSWGFGYSTRTRYRDF